MPFREPSWWYDPGAGWIARALAPASSIWSSLARRRLDRGPQNRAALPVVCVGNFTAGGTGKTPLTIHLANALRARGETPAILTRGYGSRVKAPVFVDLDRHTATEVGDEALLLAGAAPVMVSPDRVAGAGALVGSSRGFSLILMDDGLQNSALEKDFSIAVVDGSRAFGNGRVIPSGPLRAPLTAQLPLVSAVLVNGTAEETVSIRSVLADQEFQGPVFQASVEPGNDTSWLRGANVIAFAGIGNPERFYRLLETLGANVVSRRSFPDHHNFSAADADALLAEAAGRDVVLVTTQKDQVRLSGFSGSRAQLQSLTRVLPIRLALPASDDERLLDGIGLAVSRRRNRAD